MRVVSVTEAKNSLSALLDQVKRGETILIVERNVPIARLESAAGRDPDDHDGRLARLERAGLLRRGSGKVPRQILDEPPPRLSEPVDVVALLIEERREGR